MDLDNLRELAKLQQQVAKYYPHITASINEGGVHFSKADLLQCVPGKAIEKRRDCDEYPWKYENEFAGTTFFIISKERRLDLC